MANDPRSNDIIADVSKCIADSGVRWLEGLEMSSLDVITLAVKLEKHFGFQFELNEITAKNFSSSETIVSLISKRIETSNPR